MKKVLRGLQKHIDAANGVMFHRHKRVGYSIDGIPLGFTKKWITPFGSVAGSGDPATTEFRIQQFARKWSRIIALGSTQGI